MMRAEDALSQLSSALLPGLGTPEAHREAAQKFLRNNPRLVGFLIVTLSRAVAVLAKVNRAGADTFPESMAAWVRRMYGARSMLVQKLAVFLKATAAMVVLAHEDTRRQLYASEGLPLPSDIPAFSSEVPVATANHTFRGAHDIADYIVVGSGPAGSSVALELVRAGHEVLLLEEGPNVPREWAAADAIEMVTQRMRASATQVTTGPEQTPILQGRCVGGSSVINSAIAWRAPEDVFGHWHEAYGLADALPLDRVERAYETAEAAVNVEPTPRARYGALSELMQEGADKLGIDAGPTRRYTKDCEGLGRCMEGCPKGKKLAMNLTLIPEAVRLGARLLSDCKVTRVLIEGDRATGVKAVLDGRKVRIAARHGVVVAASAVGTPLLLRASGIRKPLVGSRFQAHPGASVAGTFDQIVRGERFGATQGLDSISFRESGPFKLESLSLPDEILATRLPGVGQALTEKLADLPRTALWATQIRAEAHGTVRGFPVMPVVSYHFTPRDRRALASGVRTLCELFFAAGAKEVFPGVLGVPERLTSPDELAAWPESLHPAQVTMILSHMFGTAVMGPRSDSSVCDPYGAVHGVKGLYVADSALFPTNLGVNPQHTIMAIANHVAWGILEQRQRQAG